MAKTQHMKGRSEMKFSSGVDQLQRENAYLKTITKMLLLLGAVLIGILFNLYDRPPVLVERSSHGLEIVRPIEFSPSESDTKAAIPCTHPKYSRLTFL